MEKGWVKVYIFTQEYFAELAKHMLADHGITAIVINKKDWSYQSFGHVEIYVKEENLLKAKTLLKEFDS